jgi:hypothetical protein
MTRVKDPLSQLRAACAQVAANARHVAVDSNALARYATHLTAARAVTAPDRQAHLLTGTREELAAFWLTLDAINFGSGWFPTLRKHRGRSGYFTVASGLRRRFREHGPWSPAALAQMKAIEIAAALGQDPGNELMTLFATSLRDLGGHVAGEYGGSFAAVVDRAGPFAAALVRTLAAWSCFEDTSRYDGIEIPFLKRAQIAAADLHSVRVANFEDLAQLTMFADNLVPHVLRLDGVLVFASDLVDRIERGELIEHGSGEEVEIRACAVHAVELLAASTGYLPSELDRMLWQRGQRPRYKARPRHRSRSTAY